MDVFPYTLAEAQRMLDEGTGVVPVALREEIWLLDRAQVREGLMGSQVHDQVAGIGRVSVQRSASD